MRSVSRLRSLAFDLPLDVLDFDRWLAELVGFYFETTLLLKLYMTRIIFASRAYIGL